MNNLRKRTMVSGSSGVISDGSKAEALDVLFSSNDGNELIIIRGEENWPNSGYTPIGIVVVPGTHDRYGDGTCGVMSLVGMDYSHPTSGEPITSSSQTDGVTICSGESNIGNDVFRSYYSFGQDFLTYIPYQDINGSDPCRFNNSNYVLWPYEGEVNSGYFYPSSSANTIYYNTGYYNTGTYPYVTETSGKSACDFNGIRNTVACRVGTLYSTQWTASTVTNTNSDTPAAVCAGRFKTVGTKSFIEVFTDTMSNNVTYGTPTSSKTNKGFWYLPALGELTYLPSKRFHINNTIDALNQKYGNVAIKIRTDRVLWSSTLSDGVECWGMDVSDGYIERLPTNTKLRVRAFLRFK